MKNGPLGLGSAANSFTLMGSNCSRREEIKKFHGARRRLLPEPFVPGLKIWWCFWQGSKKKVFDDFFFFAGVGVDWIVFGDSICHASDKNKFVPTVRNNLLRISSKPVLSFRRLVFHCSIKNYQLTTSGRDQGFEPRTSNMQATK